MYESTKNDDLAPARGCMNALIIMTLVYAIVGAILWMVFCR